jgi:hypothetical protein
VLVGGARSIGGERLGALIDRYGQTALQLGGLIVLVAYWSMLPTIGADADNFWIIDLADPYREPWGGGRAFVYSPAFAQLISPLTLLPYDAFYKVWTAISLSALAWLLTPIGAAIALLIPLVRAEVEGGQVHLWLAVICAIGLRYPAAWSFGLLTKVTPGVGLLWFAARREWRALRLATVVTVGVVAVSALIDPAAWRDWLRLLSESGTQHMGNLAWSEWPALFRVPIAAGLVVMAAWRNRPAALPIILCFALPAIWPGALSMVLAAHRTQIRNGLRAFHIAARAGDLPGSPRGGRPVREPAPWAPRGPRLTTRPLDEVKR